MTVKTWKEYIGNSLVTYASTTCPDSDCQKIVDRENRILEKRRTDFLNKRLQAQASK
ncbi:MAG: hypothetical protein AAB875_07715 [Patescibacteria group bacterium]